MNLSSCITSYIKSQYLEREQFYFFHFVMVQSNDQSIFFDFKNPLLLTHEFFYQLIIT
jgi:ABC-type uncharacterized transport system fused permease/ATPase subunit